MKQGADNDKDSPWHRLILVAGPGHAPFSVEALVVEEDRNLLLSDPADHGEGGVEESRPAWFLANLLESQPDHAPGSIVCVTSRTPMLLQAVVHDIEASPTWRIDWVEQALLNILGEVERRDLRSLGLPFLGTRHGNLPPEDFVALLMRIFPSAIPPCLKTLWLITPQGFSSASLIGLQDGGG